MSEKKIVERVQETYETVRKSYDLTGAQQPARLNPPSGGSHVVRPAQAVPQGQGGSQGAVTPAPVASSDRPKE